LEDRQPLNALWVDLLALRRQIAANAEYSDYRNYTWQAYARFDYTPQDCERFHDAIEQIVVPAATRISRRRQQMIGLDTLRPWDLTDGAWSRPVNPPATPPLKPYRSSDELLHKTAAMMDRLDPQLGKYFHTMIDENLLDIENRKGKAPGGYCAYLSVIKRPFILMNEVGVHDDVQTMLHEAGHAFHAFESSHLPYAQQLNPPMEFNEVASMGMELLGGAYLAASEGGFYSGAEAVRARIERLEQMIFFWPYMAVVDAFQHWAYTHPDQASDPNACDATWGDLYQRFLPALDWSGLEDELVTGWHRKLHIFHVPFYYVEYGLAALGAAQVWRNALSDQAGAVANYRSALALGNTATLPDLFTTAGARFAFDAGTIGEIVSLVETTIDSLERSLLPVAKGMV
jgi:oligoendopeptidase F